MILESYQGIQRATPFFEDNSTDMSWYMDEYQYFQYLKLFCFPESEEEQCQEMFYLMSQEYALSVNSVAITELLMTPANNFVTPNDWA